jgi:hypothetical protein
MIKSIFGLLWAFTSGIFAIFKIKNAPDIKNAAKAQQEINEEASETEAIKDRNIDEIRKNLSE